MSISTIIRSLPLAGTSALIGGFVTKFILPPIMDKLSGSEVISRNVGNIERATKDYLSQMRLSLDSPPALQNVRSVFVANGETASIMFDDGVKRQRASVRLDSEAGQWLLLQAKRQIDNPKDVLNLFQTQLPPDALKIASQKKIGDERESWVKLDAPLKRFARFFTRNVATDDTNTKIREPMDNLMKAMVVSPEENINLTGPCHMALKIIDPVTNEIDIIVMPTMKCEAELIAKIEAGEYPLPDRKITPKAILDAVVSMHTTRAEAGRYDSIGQSNASQLALTGPPL